MISEEDDGLLCDADFPQEYVNMQHPEDYTMQQFPITPSYIVNQRQGHSRLIFRISWKVGKRYMPMSFIVATGAVQPIYFGSVAMRLMETHGLLLLDDLQSDVVKLHLSDGTSCKVQYKKSPSQYDPANIIGLRFLTRFGLMIDGTNFCFREQFDHF